MVRKIGDFCKENNIIKSGDTVIVGISGGADSVCLLLVLLELQKEIDFDIKTIHVEHGIRGEESCKDARFVQELCDRLKVEHRQVSVDVLAYASEMGVGVEEGARILRYKAFEEIAKECSGSIALAHHMEDNAETIMFQMLRGSGLRGMCGMQPVRCQEDEIRYIRPLLTISRKDIENYLSEKGQEYCTDATNMDTEYSRNKLRQIVFPVLEQVNQRSVEHINTTAKALSLVWDYIDLEAKRAYEDVCFFDRNKSILSADIAKLSELHSTIQNEVIYRMISDVAGKRKDISAVHVEEVIELVHNQSGRSVNLPYDIVARREFDSLKLWVAPRKDEQEMSYDLGTGLVARFLDGKVHRIDIGNNGEYLEIRVFPFNGNVDEIPKKTYTKWFDYDKIKGDLLVRNRKSGDYLVCDNMGRTKKLKEYFVNEKIPLSERDMIWLLAKDSEIVWVIGGRISENYKVLAESKLIIEVSYNGGN